MKKIFKLSILLLLSVVITSCKSEKKKEVIKETIVPSAAFSVKNAKNTINFTAYKTTEKIPVGGQFKTVDVLSGGEGNTIKDAMNNTEFSIPVSSIFTKDTSRDFKIKKFFFGLMDNTQLLSGKLVIENDSILNATLTMNGTTQPISFKYTIEHNVFSMNATMDITKWNASEALSSLNKECYDLHKGADGVSKTWSDVAINISTVF